MRGKVKVMITFEEAWPHRVTSRFGEHDVWLIRGDELVSNKRAASRPQDRLDLSLSERQ